MEQKPPGCASASRADDLTCQQVTALLVEYVNDTLAPETMRAFQEHLRDCADCLAYLRTYRATIRALGTVATRICLPLCKTASSAFCIRG